jgi:hypothetical protein
MLEQPTRKKRGKSQERGKFQGVAEAKEQSSTDSPSQDAVNRAQLYAELVALRQRGLKTGVVGSKFPLPTLMRIADLACPEEKDDTERLRATMRTAADRCGGPYGAALRALWGVGTTFGTSYSNRRKKAMDHLDSPTEGAFNKSHRKATAEEFANQLEALYEEHRRAPVDGPGAEKTEGEPTRPTREPSLQPSLLAQLVSGRRFVSLFVIAAFAALAALVSNILAPSSPTRSLTAGAAINARTGVIERRPQVKPPGVVRFGGQPMFTACNFSSAADCTVTEGPVPAHIGDVLRFMIVLENQAPEPLPYAKLSTSGGMTLSRRRSEILASMQLIWPTGSQEESREQRQVRELIIRLPEGSGPGALRIVPGSAVLLNPHRGVVAPIPDTLNSTEGVALSNIGIPKSCFFNCLSNYIRYLEFQMRIVRSAYSFPSKK